ncbi:hypothetical protein [Roseiterribacter gracilis]|uniref:hypothetical protein n=1 Tax=Roseiterribacter gracilis TaxID=2812848 RepID=UPI003B42FC09
MDRSGSASLESAAANATNATRHPKTRRIPTSGPMIQLAMHPFGVQDFFQAELNGDKPFVAV